MASQVAHENGANYQWVSVRAEPAGHFTAQVIGLPDLHATAATREDAIAGVEALLKKMIDTGQLVQIHIPQEHPLLKWAGRRDPNDPDERAFLEELARVKKEDL